jgi:hypothetical protein
MWALAWTPAKAGSPTAAGTLEAAGSAELAKIIGISKTPAAEGMQATVRTPAAAMTSTDNSQMAEFVKMAKNRFKKK